MTPQSRALRASSRVSYSRWTSGTSVEPSSKTRLRLFCFPHAGSGASIFREWSAALPPAIEVCPVQLPGRESRWTEPPFTRLVSLVETLVIALRPLLDLPFAFFGHSMGAFISFELARQLRRENSENPAHLFVSGARAPQIPDPDPPIHQLPDSAFVEELRRLNGMPDEVLQNAELMQVVLPTLRADVTMCETYVYSADEEPLSCPISAYGGQEDRKVIYKDLAGWNAQTRNASTMQIFPGDHFFLYSAREPLLRAVSAELSGILTRMNGEQAI
jgi:medium-chain acyl-[acyl-carrier-protein] hydrolase